MYELWKRKLEVGLMNTYSIGSPMLLSMEEIIVMFMVQQVCYSIMSNVKLNNVWSGAGCDAVWVLCEFVLVLE
jgi:hypothetical protein